MEWASFEVRFVVSWGDVSQAVFCAFSAFCAYFFWQDVALGLVVDRCVSCGRVQAVFVYGCVVVCSGVSCAEWVDRVSVC